jgi:hypothetical protein
MKVIVRVFSPATSVGVRTFALALAAVALATVVAVWPGVARGTGNITECFIDRKISVSGNNVTWDYVLTWFDSGSSEGYTITAPDGTEIQRPAGGGWETYTICSAGPRTMEAGFLAEGIETSSCGGQDNHINVSLLTSGVFGRWHVESVCTQGEASTVFSVFGEHGSFLATWGCPSCGVFGNPIVARTGRKVQRQTVFSYPAKGGTATTLGH